MFWLFLTLILAFGQAPAGASDPVVDLRADVEKELDALRVEFVELKRVVEALGPRDAKEIEKVRAEIAGLRGRIKALEEAGSDPAIGELEKRVKKLEETDLAMKIAEVRADIEDVRRKVPEMALAASFAPRLIFHPAVEDLYGDGAFGVDIGAGLHVRWDVGGFATTVRYTALPALAGYELATGVEVWGSLMGGDVDLGANIEGVRREFGSLAKDSGGKAFALSQPFLAAGPVLRIHLPKTPVAVVFGANVEFVSRWSYVDPNNPTVAVDESFVGGALWVGLEPRLTFRNKKRKSE